jgi:hypothetical protein
MRMHRSTIPGPVDRRGSWVVALLIVVLALVTGLGVAHAQDDGGPIQEITGRTEPGRSVFYLLPDLRRGETLFVQVTGTSGNLDPIMALTDAGLDVSTLGEDFDAEVNVAIAEGRDPLVAISDIADGLFLAWDDDSGAGYAAAFEFTIPADGDYRLLVSSAPAQNTFGNYRLLVGLDTPEVLTGDAKPTGDTIAILDEVASRIHVAVQEVRGTLSGDAPSTYFDLNPVNAGDTLYVFVEATSGDLMPIIVLNDFGGKPLRSGNFPGQQTSATLQYTFEDDSSNNRLDVFSCPEGGPCTAGDFRLLVGINEPQVLTGEAASAGQPVLRQPTEVRVGIRMQQITDVDQKAENFGVVASLQVEWQDPALAFSPDSCQCSYKTFKGDEFGRFVTTRGIDWPASTLFNQQGNRWTQNRIVVVRPNGEALYFERFSTTLQAPDFDFTLFPFDTQQFFIHVDALFPEEMYVFSELEGFSGLGEQLGEEEWLVTDFGTSVSSQTASTESASSRFTFGFQARRHLQFYVLRFLLPLVIIIIVSWATFFLKDYGKRVDVAGANMLLFIAFNFTISDDLPRLGYLTLMDTILASTFLVTALVIVFNVYLKRLEVDGKGALAHRIDKYAIWFYPLAYLIGIALVYWWFA